MRSSRVRLEQVVDPHNLREAFLRAARAKSSRSEVIAFRENLGAELERLRAEVLEGRVAVGDFKAFTIVDPKQRRIHAPCFRERVLHHALIGACQADFERWLIADSFACRPGKGREAALRRAEHFAARYPWFLKLDVAKYFDSILQAMLMTEVERRFRDRRLVALWRRIVESYASRPGHGLPIGALTSQHLANLYLDPVDRLMKEHLRVPGFARYMDDMVAWGRTKAELKAARGAVEEFLGTRLGLCLNPRWHLQPTWRGMDFLGYRVFPGGSRLARTSRRRFLRRWRWCEAALASGRLTEAQAQRRVLALTAFVRPASNETLLARLFGGSQELVR